MKPFIYADNAATTRLSDKAFEVMEKYLKLQFGNPSSIYSLGRTARRAVLQATEAVAAAINANLSEVYFTSGGTESNNWAIRSVAAMEPGGHIITSSVEHPAVLETLKDLENQGYSITFLDTDEFGTVAAENLVKAICDNTVLITIMAANNEFGTINPIQEYGRIARENNILFHTDAVQIIGHAPIDVEKMNIDLLSMSGHKFNGPKGVGALYIRKGIKLKPLITGGGQESGLRSGTENVAGICAMAAALEEAVENMDSNIFKVSAMRDRLIQNITAIGGVALTGHPTKRLSGIASFAIEGIDGENLIYALDKAGICASSGSACSSGAMGKTEKLGHKGGALRLSLDIYNTDSDISYILETLNNLIPALRFK